MATSFKSSTGDGLIQADGFQMADGSKIDELIPYKKFVVVHNTDLNTLTDDGYYVSNAGGSGGPQNGPPAAAFANWTCHVNNLQNGMIIQYFTTITGATYTRLRNAADTWLGWGLAYGGGNGVNVIQNVIFTGMTALNTETATTAEISTLVNSILSKLQSGT